MNTRISRPLSFILASRQAEEATGTQPTICVQKAYWRKRQSFCDLRLSEGRVPRVALLRRSWGKIPASDGSSQLCTMGEHLKVENSSEGAGGERWLAESELRDRRGGGELAGGAAAELRDEPQSEHSNPIEQLEEDEVTPTPSWRSVLKSIGRAWAILVGSCAFLMSAGLLVVSCTAAYCVIVGKDFTESAVGAYVFEQSPHWDRVIRQCVQLVLRACIPSPCVLMCLSICVLSLCSFLLLVEAVFSYLYYRRGDAHAAFRWPNPAACILAVERRREAEFGLEGSDPDGLRSAALSKWEDEQFAQAVGLNCGRSLERFSLDGEDREGEHLLLPVDRRGHGGLLRFLGRLICSVVPVSFQRGFLYLMRQRAQEEAAQYLQSVRAEAAMRGIELRGMGRLNPEAASTAVSGQPQTGTLTPGSLSSVDYEESSCSSSEASGTSGRQSEDGDDEWCFVASEQSAAVAQGH
ncbi:hypothetical protein Efla_007082 [Eimeria flavescens]